IRERPWEECEVGGYPLLVPMLDMHTIGSGGGSIVDRDDIGSLQVGPESTGSDPGPACYGRGGNSPTVVDSAVVAGRLPGQLTLGNSLDLQPQRAREALSGLTSGEQTIEEIALDVLRLTETNIAYSIRERTVARGMNPDELDLIAGGGAGPLLAGGIADFLDLNRVIIPPAAGVLASWGLLCAPRRQEYTTSILTPLESINPEKQRDYLDEIYNKLGKPDSFNCKAYLRYQGQGFELPVPINENETNQEIARKFHDIHRKEYGFAEPERSIEWISLRGETSSSPPDWNFSAPAGFDRSLPEKNTVAVRDNGTISTEEALVRNRGELSPGNHLEGPAIIPAKSSTTYIPPCWEGVLNEKYYLILRRKE
ncbi:MAG: hydantoinase/oxoprolinase family protein, partial [bacterium]